MIFNRRYNQLLLSVSFLININKNKKTNSDYLIIKNKFTFFRAGLEFCAISNEQINTENHLILDTCVNYQ